MGGVVVELMLGEEFREATGGGVAGPLSTVTKSMRSRHDFLKVRRVEEYIHVASIAAAALMDSRSSWHLYLSAPRSATSALVVDPTMYVERWLQQLLAILWAYAE